MPLKELTLYQMKSLDEGQFPTWYGPPCRSFPLAVGSVAVDQLVLAVFVVHGWPSSEQLLSDWTWTSPWKTAGKWTLIKHFCNNQHMNAINVCKTGDMQRTHFKGGQCDNGVPGASPLVDSEWRSLSQACALALWHHSRKEIRIKAVVFSYN